MMKKIISILLLVITSFILFSPGYTAINLDVRSVSKLGHVSDANVVLYNEATLSPVSKIGSDKVNTVYYIKRELMHNNQLYYLISTRPSHVSGVLGWVKSSDVRTHNHRTIGRRQVGLYVNGNGFAYSKAWGGQDDIVYSNMSEHKFEEFKVDLVETVGNNIWYRGMLGGERVFLHQNHVSTKQVTSTSKLGHIRSAGVAIYDKDSMDFIRALDRDDLNQVYYIKQQLIMTSNNPRNNERYYLISTSPSAFNGVLGWVSSTDLSTHEHRTVGREASGLYVNGRGSAYSKAWGGRKDIIYEDLTAHQFMQLEVDLVETVGTNTWYRGMLNGQRVFIHENHLSRKEVTPVSRLGKVTLNGASVLDKYSLSPKQQLTSSDLNRVYYIKEQLDFKSNNRNFNESYSLLSIAPSAKNGVIGWVKNSDIRTHEHRTIATNAEPLYITGSGSAFEKAWGDKEDIVIENLSDFQGELFEVTLVERVGNNTWYRGWLNGSLVFLHENWLKSRAVNYVNYNRTLNEMLDIQMTRSPQTDKYSREPAYVHSSTVSQSENQALINGSGVALRTSPNTSVSNNIHARVNSGTPVIILGSVTGSSFNGSTKWYKIRYNDPVLNNNVELYVHSLLVTESGNNSIIATVNSNVRSAPNSSAHIYGRISRGSQVRILDTVQGASVSGNSTWYQVPYSVWRLPTRADVEKYLNPEKQDIYQFLLLSHSANASASDLNKLLVSKGVLEGKGASFSRASQQHSVNEAYLISHSLLETGHGRSTLARGVRVGLNRNGTPTLVTSSNSGSLTNIKTVYNVYGIGAVDADPIARGAIYAYNRGWDSVEKAIEDGAMFVSLNYFQRNQRTLYEMRWNPANPGTHQYATDIAWAAKQVSMIRNIHENLLPNLTRYYRMPKYR